MKSFKFLTSAKPPITGRYWGGTNTQGITFSNGNTIMRITENLTANMNRFQYVHPLIIIHSFFWVRNYNHRLILGENFRTNTEVYEGTIDRFM